jgi:hypothetical protein
VEHEKSESAEVKSHEEIVELFKELRLLEQKVKNPNLVVAEIDEPRIKPQDVEPVRAPLPETIVERHPLEPRREIQGTEKEKGKKPSPIISVQKTVIEEQKKEPRSLWRKEKTRALEPQIPTNTQQVSKEKIPSQSTFTLQLDPEGNLIGFPLKKHRPEKKGGENEPSKGIKARFLRMIPGRKSTESSSEESQGGIGSKIKGIFKRK